MRATLMLLALIFGSVVPAAALTLDRPVRRPGVPVTSRAPAYAGDVFEVRLAAPAARTASRARLARGAADGRSSMLGVAAVDQAASTLGGIWFTPEFRGESAPAPGSDEPDFTAFYVAHLPEGVLLEDALERFRQLGDVVAADPIAILHVDVLANDSLFATSYWLYQPPLRRDIHAPEAWDVTTGDSSIVVAVLDTGVLPYHPDLGGRVAGLPGQIWTNWREAGGLPGVDDDGNGYVDDIHGWDFVTGITDLDPGEDGTDQDNDPNDYAAHGTAVAGLIGAIADNGIGLAGVAPRVRIMPLRMGFAYNGAAPGEAEVRMDFAAAAIRYATRMGASVINCSWESDATGGIDAAITAAVHAGVTIVSAAGNNGGPHHIGDRDDVLAIGASDRTDAVAWFSNPGPFVDLVAPGVDMASTWVVHAAGDSIGLRQPAYVDLISGTSLAAPLVSGAAALIQTQRKNAGLRPITPRGVQLRLMDTADDISAQNPTLAGQYGAGRLNVAEAVTRTDRSTATRTRSISVGPSVVLPVVSGGVRVAYAAFNRKLVIFDPATDDTLAIANIPATPSTGITAGDIGNKIGLFVSTLNAGVAGFGIDGTPLPGWPQAGSAPYGMTGGPALGDIAGDGRPEIVCGADDGQLWAWDADGNVVPGFPVSLGSTAIESAVAVEALASPDTLTAKADIIAATGGMLHVIQGDGSERPGWPVAIPGGFERAPVVLRAAGTQPLVVAVAGRSLHLFDRFGIERPGFPVTLAGNAAQDPALGDLDGNGIDDIVIATSGPAAIEVRDTTGASLSAQNWPRPLPANPQGPPVTGFLGPGLGKGVMVMRGGGLLALSTDADSMSVFPKPGGAGSWPTITEDIGQSVNVVAGTGSDSLFYIYRSGGWRTSPVTGGPPWPTPRGNFARTGSHGGTLVLAIDDVPPAAISDLRPGAISDSTIRLYWTAPSDVGYPPMAAAYEVRRASFPLTDANFASGVLVPGAPTPAAAGAAESLLVRGLLEGTNLYVAVRSRDRWGNVSPISNMVQATTSSSAPGAVIDLRETAVTDSSVWLAWTATGDDGTVGRPRLYAVRAARQPIDDASFQNAPEQRTVSATVDAGGREGVVFLGLAPATRYWFALKAVDFAGNVSRLSNVISVQTGVGGPLASRKGAALAVLEQPSRASALLYWQGAPDGEGSRQTIELYDLTGRRLRVLEVGTGVGGRQTWDGRDADGRRVPAGLYYARLLSGSVHVQTRLVLLP